MLPVASTAAFATSTCVTVRVCPDSNAFPPSVQVVDAYPVDDTVAFAY